MNRKKNAKSCTILFYSINVIVVENRCFITSFLCLKYIISIEKPKPLFIEKYRLLSTKMENHVITISELQVSQKVNNTGKIYSTHVLVAAKIIFENTLNC